MQVMLWPCCNAANAHICSQAVDAVVKKIQVKGIKVTPEAIAALKDLGKGKLPEHDAALSAAALPSAPKDMGVGSTATASSDPPGSGLAPPQEAEQEAEQELESPAEQEAKPEAKGMVTLSEAAEPSTS